MTVLCRPALSAPDLPLDPIISKEDSIWKTHDGHHGCWLIVRDQVKRASMSGFNRNQTLHELHMGPCSQPFPWIIPGSGAMSANNGPPSSRVTSTSWGRRGKGDVHARSLGGDGHNSHPSGLCFFSSIWESKFVLPISNFHFLQITSYQMQYYVVNNVDNFKCAVDPLGP